MMFNSIRSRLALSFAAIALVAAVVLGAVLLVILQSYYSNQELDYMRGNAKFIGGFVTEMTGGNASHDAVQSQIENLAFLTQTRIQVYDAIGHLLYDSGSPERVDVNLGVARPFQAPQVDDKLPNVLIRIIGTSNRTSTQAAPDNTTATASPSALDAKGVIFYRSVKVSGSPFGFNLSGEASSAGLRSNQVVSQAVTDPKNGANLGTVELSEGPAYGRDVLTSVAVGWALASAVAVLLAAAIGWYISRRISAPVLALTAVTTRMAHGELSSRAGMTSRDEFGQLAHSFDEMADQVEGTVHTLRRFVSDAAHELQTPVTALRANLDLAAEESGRDERGVYIERAEAAVKRLEGLMNDLLDLSRLEAGSSHGTEKVIDIAELVRERIEVYASQAEQAGLTLEVEGTGEAVLVRAEETPTLRALDNLVDNACKFTPQGGTVTLRLHHEQDAVVFSVSDTGIGIPEEDLSQLFQRFHRGRNATSRQGSGLGLAIVKAIMEREGGEVTAENLATGVRFSLKWAT